MNHGAFGLPKPLARPGLQTRHIDVLRLLGRLDVMTIAQLHTIVYAGQRSKRTVQRDLHWLEDEQLIWHTTARYATLPGQQSKRMPPRKYPYIYGLAPAGKAVLESLGVEPDAHTLDNLKIHEGRSRRGAAATLAHALLVSWWCSSVLLAVQHSPICHDIFVQAEYVTHDRQRLDALVVLRLTPQQPQPQETGSIPWSDGRPCPPDALEIRLGLEVDRGTEPLSVLAGKATVTQELQRAGLYHTLLGGPIRTVFLVPNRKRAAKISAEWRTVWPATWGCISTPQACEHPQYGTLWGDYRALRGGKESVNLVSDLVEGADGRVRARAQITLEQWAALHAADPPT
jgi:hypothetical protein